MFIQGPLLFKRPAVEPSERAAVSNYAIVQENEEDHSSTQSPESVSEMQPSSTANPMGAGSVYEVHNMYLSAVFAWLN
ncbi:hypothetical protein GGR52DRAFT_551790 [Hypoxylon sp. FL1284]|nr:hypothetical protein GGR52DRAFT_551790 [Hypoxylon sp. FL1284]